MAIKRVRDIRPMEKPQLIEIRVVKKWIAVAKPTMNKKDELCYQFVDQHGDGIEATGEPLEIEYVDSIILLNACYKVSGYVCTKARGYMATVNHTASIVIGRKAKFVPVENPNIPSMCFSFISYDLLFNRIKNNKVLTDFIGRVEKNYPFTTSKNVILTKVVLCDERMKRVEITLWPEKRHLIGTNVGPGNIVAITSTQVSKYSMMQLESTHLTKVVINRDTPQTAEYVARLKALPTVQPEDLEDPMLTLQELTSTQRAQEQKSTRFRCHAWIEKIHENRGWFYVHCSKCNKKLYPEQDGSLNYVCKDDEDISLKFLFSLNAIINDSSHSTKPVDVTFFDEGMVSLLKTTCAGMMTKNGYTDPKMIPKEIHDMIGKAKIMHISIRGKQYVVTSVSDPPVVQTSTDNIQQQNMGAPPPKTPNPKLNQQKRPLDESPDNSNTSKKRRMGCEE